MLRDSSGAAESLTRVLSGSRYVGELMEWIPESAAWLDDRGELRPRSGVALQRGGARDPDAARDDRRRDALGASAAPARAAARWRWRRSSASSRSRSSPTALTTITEVTIQATLRAVRRSIVPARTTALDFSVIAMGRFGGRELGFGSDADVMYVYRPNGVDPQRAHELADADRAPSCAGTPRITACRSTSTPACAPRAGTAPIARSLDAYARVLPALVALWEAQALLRARGVAGSVKLIGAFTELADEVRYPAAIGEQEVREIKRIKARVENERLPQGADPARHLKLGPRIAERCRVVRAAACSCEHAARCPGCARPRPWMRWMRRSPPSTASSRPPTPAAARRVAVRLPDPLRHDAVDREDGRRAAVRPPALEGVARLLEYPAGGA